MFAAQVTAVTTSGGVNYYTYAEQVTDGVGGYAALESGRSGSGAASGAVEINNALLTIPGGGLFVWMRLRGAQDNGALYEFVNSDNGTGVTGTGTDNHVARWDGTGVAAMKDSSAILRSYTGGTALFLYDATGTFSSSDPLIFSEVRPADKCSVVLYPNGSISDGAGMSFAGGNRLQIGNIDAFATSPIGPEAVIYWFYGGDTSLEAGGSGSQDLILNVDTNGGGTGSFID